MVINERVKEIRKALKLSQAKFAEKAAISSGLIGGIETGASTVSEHILINICYKLGVNEEWFRTGKGEMFNASYLSRQASAIFEKLNPKAQEYALAMLEGLLELQNDEKKEALIVDAGSDTCDSE